MLTNLKMSLLPCKHVLYRPEHSGKGGNVEMKYTNGQISMSR